MNSRKNALINHLSPLHQQLLNHPIYQEINKLETLHVFMEHHVFAVWDFMSLLKKLQIELTSTSTPWIPVGNAKTRRLINEIVFGEESDIDSNGNVMSHFELYLDAMLSAGASTSSANKLIKFISEGTHWKEALNLAQVPEAAKEFNTFTMSMVNEGKVHEIAASFALGREDLIPDMFSNIVEDLNTEKQLNSFQYYLQRHIELDGDEHGDLAWEMLFELCGDDNQKWQEATVAASNSLIARIKLWDGVLALSRQQKETLLTSI